MPTRKEKIEIYKKAASIRKLDRGEVCSFYKNHNLCPFGKICIYSHDPYSIYNEYSNNNYTKFKRLDVFKRII